MSEWTKEKRDELLRFSEWLIGQMYACAFPYWDALDEMEEGFAAITGETDKQVNARLYPKRIGHRQDQIDRTTRKLFRTLAITDPFAFVKAADELGRFVRRQPQEMRNLELERILARLDAARGGKA